MAKFKVWLGDLGRVLWPLVLLMLAWVLLFEIFRVILIAATWSLRSDATPAILCGSLLHGLRFDLAMAARLLPLFVLWKIWRPTPGRVEKYLVQGVLGIVVFACVFALTAEVEFYKEFQMRLGPLAFEYFGKPEHNKIIFGMIWHGYPVVRWMLVCLALGAALFWVCRRILVGKKPRPSTGTSASPRP